MWKQIRRPNTIARGALVVALGVTLALFAASCGGKSKGHAKQENKPSMPGAKASTTVERANVDLAFRYLASVDAKRSGNVVVSPLSLSLVLQMLANGADTSNKTQAKLLRALGFADGVEIDTVNAVNRNLIEALTAEGSGVDFEIANGIWTAPGYTPTPALVDTVTSDYQGTADRLAEDATDAAAQINDWASDNTRKRITEIIKPEEINPPDGQRVMFLGNALAFTGKWTSKFNKKQTAPAVFHITPTKSVKVDMMRQEAKFETLHVDGRAGFAAVRLPYGKSKRWAMYVLVPTRRDGLDDVLESLTPDNWNSWIDRFGAIDVNVQIPRLDMRYQRDLLTDLAELGVPQGTYNSLVTGSHNPIEIDFARQQTYMKVDEEGTKAAAVTVIGVSETALVISPPIVADHPYAMVLADKRTGSIAFIAAIRDPTQHKVGL